MYDINIKKYTQKQEYEHFVARKKKLLLSMMSICCLFQNISANQLISSNCVDVNNVINMQGMSMLCPSKMFMQLGMHI